MRIFGPLLLLAMFILAGNGARAMSPELPAGLDPPNIIFILCDDLGWGDLGILHQNNSNHDKTFATPRLDEMAQQGVQLRQHYCPAPVCAPSRASLLLGVHQGHCEVRDNQFDKALPENHTLATVLKSAGYTTAIVGKYGLQGRIRDGDQENRNPERWSAYPTQRGFDDFFGYVRHVDGHVHYPAHHWPLGNSKSHQSPKQVWHNDREISSDLAGCYTTDLFTAYAKQWIEKQQSQAEAKPFFLYLAFDTPHAALQVPSCDYPQGRGLNGGVQWLGTPGKMINTADGNIDSFRDPAFTGKGWSDVEERFATMVRRIDDCVGDLLQTLRDLKIDDNTLVVFSSDNGPHHEAYLRASYDPISFQSYGPFDGTKRDCWEGGIRVPTLAWWPGRIPAGTIDRTPSQFHDWMATFCDAAGISPPARTDGVSLLPTMAGKKERVASKVYVEYRQNGRTRDYPDFSISKRKRKRGQAQVIILDEHKGIRVDIQRADQPFEIYNLRDDPDETVNLADTNDRMRLLQRRMQQQVVRMRRSNSSAKRPYDDVLIPGVEDRLIQSGSLLLLRNHSQPGFVPVDGYKLTGAAQISAKPGKPIRGTSSDAVLLTGFIRIPEDASYRFTWTCNQPAVVHLHDAILIDDDYGFAADQSKTTTLGLRAGIHPIAIRMLTGLDQVDWKLEAVATEGGNDVLADENAWGYSSQGK